MRGSPTISRSANIRFAYLPARDNRVSLIFTLSPEGGRSRKLLFEGKIDNSNFIIVIKLRYYRVCICICISVRCILIKFVEANGEEGGRRGVTYFTSMKRSGIFGERMYTRYGRFARIRSKLESPSIGGSSERVSGVFPIAAPAAIV